MFKFVEMGFCNGLCIKKEIFQEVLPYLMIAAKSSEFYKEGEPLFSFYFKTWEKALESYCKDKGINLIKE